MPKYRVRVPELIEHLVEVDCVDEQSAMIVAYQIVMNEPDGYTTESQGTDARGVTVERVFVLGDDK